MVIDLTVAEPLDSGSGAGSKRKHDAFVTAVSDVAPTDLCIYASDVAAIAGYNEHVDVGELFDKYLYQGCEYLRYLDAAELGLQVLTREEQLQSVLAGMSNKEEIHEILKVKAGNRKAKVAGDIAAAVQEKIDDSSRKNEVKVQDLIVLSSLVSNTYKEFGTENERAVIDLYEAKTGHSVQRLDRLLRISVYSDECVVSGASTCREGQTEARPRAGEPLFQIVGRVDGVSRQGGEQVVLEVKNRIRCVPSSPPLKDLIQLVVYLKMLGAQLGHLVQCVLGADCDTLGVYALDLRREPFHLEEFDRSVLPRLRTFSEAVLRTRANEGLRREWLEQDERWRLAAVLSSCAFLEEAVRRCSERLTALEQKVARDANLTLPKE